MAVAIFQGGTGVGAYSGKFDADGSYSVRIAIRGGGRGACDYHLDVARGG
jgi:hypothetical protein